MRWDDMREAFNDAKQTTAQADAIAADMGRMLVGRLPKLSQTTLRALKKELRRYNPHTDKWS